MELLVPGPKLLRAPTIGQEAAEPPRSVAGAADFLGHLIDDFIEESVGVDEEESPLLADQIGDELAGVAEAD